MNADFAHLLTRPQTVDWQALGAALKAEIRARGLTLQQVSDEARLSRATISRASIGHSVSLDALLVLCIWADLNPFELLRPFDRSPAEYIHPRTAGGASRGCFT